MSWFGNLLGGVGNVVGGLVGTIPGFKGVGDVLSSALGGTSAAIQEQDARNWQSQQNAQNLATQFGYNKQLQEQSQAFNAAEAQKTRDWNSIGAQMSRAAQAGINPLAMLGATGAGSSQAMGTSGTSSVGLPSVSNVPSGIVDLANLSSVLKSTAEARKTEKETTRYDEQIDALLSNYAADITLKKAQTDAINIANDIAKIYGKTKASYECIKLFNEALLASQQGDEAAAKAKLAKAQEKLSHVETKIKDAQAPLIILRMEEDIKLVQQQQKTEEKKQSALGAQAVESSAHAKLYDALTNTENSLRSGKVELQDLLNDSQYIENQIKGNEFNFLDATLADRIVATAENAAQQGLITQKAVEDLKQAKVKTDWAGRQEFADYCSKFIGSFSQAVGAFTNLRGVELQNLNAKERNRVRDRFNDVYSEAHKKDNSSSKKVGDIFEHLPESDKAWYEGKSFY